MKRKIALFSSTWYSEYTTTLISGIRKRIQDEDVILHVFNTYDASEKTDLVQKEMDILHLPDLSEYDGILVVYNSVGQYPQIESLVKDFAATGKKVLCIDQEFGGQPYIGIDNYHSFYQIVEHLITVHGCKTLNYLGGPVDSQDNIQRMAAFLDCLRDYGISPEPERILQLHFLNSDGPIAYKQWKEKDLHLPDAVVCASDYMALGYAVAALEDGYVAPKDYRISGFDNIEEAQLYSPSITSVNRNWEELGYSSICHLLDMMDGKKEDKTYYIKGGLCINESCGCHTPKMSMEDALMISYHSKKKKEILGMWSRKFLQLLCSTRSMTDVQSALSLASEHLSLDHYTFCLNCSSDANNEEGFFEDYTDTLTYVTKDAVGQISRTELIPSELYTVGEQILFFTPLHFGTHNFGYSIVPFYDDLLQYDKHRKITDYVALSLECTTQSKMLLDMNRKLKTLYLQDQLTELYNRFGYMDLATEYYREQQGKICVYYMDIDNLKPINDTYGHSMGDKAIKGLADGIKKIFTDAPIKVRMGGDEFLVIESLQTEEESLRREAKLDQFLSDLQVQTNLPFPISVSMGHIRNEDSSCALEDLVHQADTKMYELKQKRKKALIHKNES